MDIGSWLVIAGLTLLVAVFVARPLVERKAAEVSEGERRLSALKAERDKILTTIREIEMDHAMGKLDADVYQSQRAALVAEGAGVLREIDGLEPHAAVVAAQGGQDVDARLEAEIARRRGQGAAERVGFCVKCGQPLIAGDKFCSRCGTPVGAEEKV